MKKLSLLLIFFTLFSCSKTPNMAQVTTISSNGSQYSSTVYTTTTEFLKERPGDPRSRNIVKVTMTTTGVGGYVFTYYYTDKHLFTLRQNAAIEFEPNFSGDILVKDGKLEGKAYDNKGNYIIFSDNSGGGGEGGGTPIFPILTTDPASPVPGEAWLIEEQILAGEAMGTLGTTYATTTVTGDYELKIKTNGDIKTIQL